TPSRAYRSRSLCRRAAKSGSWWRARTSLTKKPSGCRKTSRGASKASSSTRARSRSRSSARRAPSTMPSDTVAERTEAQLIHSIKTRLPPPPDWLAVGIGDDAAVVEPARNRLEVLSVDALVEGGHFDRTFTPPFAVGPPA